MKLQYSKLELQSPQYIDKTQLPLRSDIYTEVRQLFRRSLSSQYKELELKNPFAEDEPFAKSSGGGYSSYLY